MIVSFKIYHIKEMIVLPTVTYNQIPGDEKVRIFANFYVKKLINVLNSLGYLLEVKEIGKMGEIDVV